MILRAPYWTLSDVRGEICHKICLEVQNLLIYFVWSHTPSVIQGGITCGAIDEPRKSSKAIDERVIINFRDKNVVIARFHGKYGGYLFYR